MGNKLSEETEEGLISHGICKKCYAALVGSKKSSLIDFLESLNVPVLVVNSDVSVDYANKHARNILQKELPKIEGFKGGDVFECAYAKLHEGCGATIHCAACTIRNTINDTLLIGNSHLRTPAYLTQGTIDDNQEIKYLISTEKVAGVVLLRIDNIGEGTNKHGK
jgi:hypothetical protein